MRVLAFAPNEYDTSPGQRFRIEQWEPRLRGRGIEITYSAFMSSSLSRLLYQPGRHVAKAVSMLSDYIRQLGAVTRARRFDLVYVFREAALLGPAVIESLIAWQRIPIVYDFDDAIFVPYRSPSNSYLSYLKCFGKTSRICRLARHVMVGNRHLRDYAVRYNSEVTIVPTTIDTDSYRLDRRRPRGDGIPVVGWTGSYSTFQHLLTARGALERLARRSRFRLVVIGAGDPEIRGVQVEVRPWRADTEVEDLADIDIGIMPLPDDPWSRGKCGLKALQYMALGIPAVVSPVGVNAEIVTDGMNGFVVSGDDAWTDRLTRLIENRELRERLGASARKTVEERYSARVVAPRVFQVFEKAVSESTAGATEAEPRQA